MRLPSLTLSIDDYSATLTVDGTLYHTGTRAPIVDRYHEILADHAEYRRAGCPAWDAMREVGQALGMPTHWHTDLSIVDLHWALAQQSEPADRQALLWAIGDTGTHLVFAGQHDAVACVETILRLWPDHRWYAWDGRTLAYLGCPEQVRRVARSYAAP